MSRSAGVRIWVVDARVTVATSAGRAASRCRPITTPLGPAAHPATDITILILSTENEDP
jgi:hypothetical protein